MSDQEKKQQKNVRGLFLTIGESGQVNHQIVGKINEAEFLGLGTYVGKILTREGFTVLVENQKDFAKSIDNLIKIIVEKEEKEEELCGKVLPSEDSPLSDSGPSLENSRDQLKE